MWQEHVPCYLQEHSLTLDADLEFSVSSKCSRTKRSCVREISIFLLLFFTIGTNPAFLNRTALFHNPSSYVIRNSKSLLGISGLYGTHTSGILIRVFLRQTQLDFTARWWRLRWGDLSRRPVKPRPSGPPSAVLSPSHNCLVSGCFSMWIYYVKTEKKWNNIYYFVYRIISDDFLNQNSWLTYILYRYSYTCITLPQTYKLTGVNIYPIIPFMHLNEF